MKKLISLGLASAMVASMASSVFATTIGNGSMSDLKVYKLIGDATSTVGLKSETVKDQTINGASFTDCIYITGTNTDKVKLVFGVSNTCLFGKTASKPANQQIIQAASSSPIKKTAQGNFTNRGVTFTVGSFKTNSGHGEYNGTQGVTITFTNSSTSDQYAANTVTLTDINGVTRSFNVVTKACALDKDDTSAADVDANDEGYRDFSDGTKLKNGHAIFASTLKEMIGKGKYCFYGDNGVNILTSVSQATVNNGKTTFNAVLSTDTALDSRYNANGSGKILKLQSNFLPLENRQVNIDFENAKVVDLVGTDFADKITNGGIKRLYVYPIDQAGYDSLAKASGNDGLINTDNVISANVSSSKVVFNLPKDITDVIISLKELDTTSLPAIPGVTVSNDAAASEAANEIIAPVVNDAADVVSSNSQEVAPSVVNAPILTSVPAATNAGQQNTGASDVVTLAIALVAISMGAAATVAFKRS